jgi:hypothetical protein
MRDVLVVTGVIAFFALGAAYIALCARILADAGDIDQPNVDDDADATHATHSTEELTAR